MWLNVLQKIIMTNQKVKNLFSFQNASRNKTEFRLLLYKLILYNLQVFCQHFASTLASAQKRKWQLNKGAFWWVFLVGFCFLVGWLAGCCQIFFSLHCKSFCIKSNICWDLFSEQILLEGSLGPELLNIF